MQSDNEEGKKMQPCSKGEWVLLATWGIVSDVLSIYFYNSKQERGM